MTLGGRPDTMINLRTRPEAHNTQYLEAMAVYNHVKGRVKGLKVLDAGCGYGYGAYFLGGSAEAVTGVDFSAQAIDAAKKEYRRGNVGFFSQDLEKLSFADGAFDAVCLFEVIHLVRDHRAVLKEISRVLKPGGVFYMSTRNWPQDRINNDDPAHRYCFTKGKWKELLREYGLEAQELSGISRPRQVYQLEEELKGIRSFDPLGIRRLLPRIVIAWAVFAVSKFKGLVPPQEMRYEDFEISAANLENSPGVFFICRKG